MSIGKKIFIGLGEILKLLPKRKVVLFRSFHGQYNCNPKYISEEIHKIDKEINIYWAISDEANKKDIPEYVNIIRYNSFKYYYYILCSKVVVDNYYGIIYSWEKKKNRLLEYWIRNKRQLNISTWHGTPLKYIGSDQKEYNNCFFYSSTDFITANSKYLKRILEDSFGVNNVKLLGSPRNDVLINSSNKNELKEKLGLPNNKKIILFAPTFRKSLYESGERQLKEIDIDKLLEVLKEKFDGEWILVARVHNEVLKKFDFSILKNKNNIINGNTHDDMAEYLAVSDILITDYSGSMFDYLYTKKPCFLLTLDRKEYEKNDRNFYFKLNSLPFPCATDIDSLYSKIKSFDNDKYKNKVEAFMQELGCIDDGKSSKRIANIIIKYYKNGKIEEQKYNEE